MCRLQVLPHSFKVCINIIVAVLFPIIAAFTFVNLMNSPLGGSQTATGSAVREALVLNQDVAYGWSVFDFLWCGLLGVLGGLL